MTVGRILGNRDADVVIGSTAVPGAFTREAWEKYLRKAFADVSKGTIKGDDWVLAVTSQDDLGKDGEVERNRHALELLYRQDYEREWKKFLQGVVVQDFGNLANAAQGLTRLADSQNSAFRLLFAKAAYETAWDDPNQLSKSIEAARNSVIERTEKLVLGSPATGEAARKVQLGETGAKFAGIGALVTAPEGGRIPLSAYLDVLTKLKNRLSQINASAEQGAQAKALMQATLNASGSEFSEGLAVVDNVLLAGASDETREIVRPLLLRPLLQAYTQLVPMVEQDINRSWQAEVLPMWRGLSAKYPFADVANEAAMADIAKFLKPGEGTLQHSIDKNLGGVGTRQGDQLVAKTWGNLGVSFNPAFLSGVSGLTKAGNSVLLEGDGLKFELQPIPTPGLSEIIIEVDGQSLRYRNGPQPWTSFSWPNINAGNNQGARIHAISFAGEPTTVASHAGRLGLMRLISQARIDDRGDGTTLLEWKLRPLATGDRNNVADSSPDVVRFNMRTIGGASPLALSGFRRLGLPEKIVARGG